MGNRDPASLINFLEGLKGVRDYSSKLTIFGEMVDNIRDNTYEILIQAQLLSSALPFYDKQIVVIEKELSLNLIKLLAR